MSLKRKCYGAILLGAMLLPSCSGKDNSSSTGAITGVFLDGPATGVRYVFGRYSGTTGPGGTFACEREQIGQFRVGNLILGQSLCGAVITPIDLIKNGNPQLSPSQAQTSALPLVQFLMSVGSVGSDGTIAIPEPVSARAASQSANLLTADYGTMLGIARTITDNPSLAYVDATSASDHLVMTLSNIDQAKHAGEYVSSSWDNTAAAHFLVKPDGALTGYLLVSNGYTYQMMGTVSSSGALSLSIRNPTTQEPVPSSTTSGKSDGLGTLSGTSYRAPNEAYQYVLQRVTPTTQRYYGVFRGALTNDGSAKADCWFAIDTSGKLYGFESGAPILGTSTSSLTLKGEVNMATGTISLTNLPGSSDIIAISGAIGADGRIKGGVWQGKYAFGTFSGAKLPLQ